MFCVLKLFISTEYIREANKRSIVIRFRNNILMETGLVEREMRIWHGMKPICAVGKTVTEESLVSVEIKDVASLLGLLSIGFLISLTVLVMEIIVHRYREENTKPTEKQ